MRRTVQRRALGALVAVAACGDGSPTSQPPPTCEAEPPPVAQFVACARPRFDGRLYGVPLAIPPPFLGGRATYADVDGDGDLDMVVTDGAAAVDVMLGSGDGLFSAPSAVPIAQPIASGVADFDGDGATDIAVLESESSLAPGVVHILRNQGGGSFAELAAYPALPDVIAMAVGNVDGDAAPEIVVSYRNDNQISIFDWNGATFVRQEVGTGAGQGFGTFELELGDLDRDGTLDIVTTNRDRTFSVIANNGGGFNASSTVVFAQPGNLPGLRLYDFDADGWLDVLVSYQDLQNQGELVLFRNSQTGGFTTQSLLTLSAQFAFDVGDLDRDGDTDIVTQTMTWLAQGQSFMPGQQLLTQMRFAHVADVNGDGALDLLASTDLGIAVFDGTGDGSFAQATFGLWPPPPDPNGLPPPDFTSGAFADLDGDGDKDFASAASLHGTDPTYKGQLSIVYREGDHWASPVVYGLDSESTTVLAGDLDGDCRPDLIIGGTILVPSPQPGWPPAPSNVETVFLNAGSRVFTQLPMAPGSYDFARLADVNGDGLPDLLFRDAQAPLVGHGDGTFGEWSTNPIGVPFGFYALADLDGDGNPDLVESTKGALRIARGRGAGIYDPPLAIGTFDSEYGVITVADLDSDGSPDVVVGGQEIDVHVGHGGQLDPPIRVVAIGGGTPTVYDANGDGTADLSQGPWVTLQHCLP